MSLPPAVVVHGLAHARAALAAGRPLTLLSAPGAALYAGCGWWAALVALAHAEHPWLDLPDILDCGDGSGQAMAALRIGQRALVLTSLAPGRAAVAAAAAELGRVVLDVRPPALDMADRDAGRRLHAWLRAGATPDDSAPALR
jgi:hypothetical protein